MADQTPQGDAAANRAQLAELLIDVLLLEPDEFNFELNKEDVETWDSLGVVSLAVGVHEEYGYHYTPEEANGIGSVRDIMDLLQTKGIAF